MIALSVRRVTVAMLALLLLAAVLPTHGAAYCTQPQPPQPPYAQPPAAPFCARGYYGQKCGEMEVENYRREVERYISEMQRYAEQVDRFADSAVNWARCQSQEAVNAWNGFARGY